MVKSLGLLPAALLLCGTSEGFTPLRSPPSGQTQSQKRDSRLEVARPPLVGTVIGSPVQAPAAPPGSKKMRYSSEDWLENLTSLPISKIGERIFNHLLANTLWACAVLAIDEWKPELFSDFPTLPHTVLASSLSLLLVFRTNASYDRWWEARKVWGAIVNKSREMATFVFSSTDPQYHLTLGAFVCLAPFAMKQHLQGVRDPEELLKKLRDFGVELSEVERKWLMAQENIPLIIFKFQQEALKVALRGGQIPDGSDGTNRFLLKNTVREGQQKAIRSRPEETTEGGRERERAEVADRAMSMSGNIEYSLLYVVPMIVRAQQMVGDMIDNLGKCERILKSPVPLSYSRHTSRLLSVFCATLPMALVHRLDLLTPPVMLLVGWGLFAIEEIGHYIEEPFSLETNVLGLQGICGTIERGVKGVLSQNEEWDCGRMDAAQMNHYIGLSGMGGGAEEEEEEERREGMQKEQLDDDDTAAEARELLDLPSASAPVSAASVSVPVSAASVSVPVSDTSVSVPVSFSKTQTQMQTETQTQMQTETETETESPTEIPLTPTRWGRFRRRVKNFFGRGVAEGTRERVVEGQVGGLTPVSGGEAEEARKELGRLAREAVESIELDERSDQKGGVQGEEEALPQTAEVPEAEAAAASSR
uniref:Bestrophin homolog n=1 Tax=Chromera velia CCMP2878 TaxID=1169474 RepID=A0A0G4FR41_9ALVE|eukprot:Cvel_453.t1-p1 / transcript=Cvel_453.t1 / gene=Cvel_453 / organism=Chromera_velia_CCMP2878 / gene_product=UPF0187 protein alr2987, putative / transcript_product=UPF0187 protein alr2987, putative / location=Cvel_scaffold14:179017-182548(+) / protein_length=646 / sequence_SO=supercontig / SO=protein_coding / is_pseudo=false